MPKTEEPDQLRRLDDLAAPGEERAGLAAGSIGSVATDYRDLDALRGSTQALKRLVDQHEAALAAGKGVFVDDHGRMADEAVIRSARS